MLFQRLGIAVMLGKLDIDASCKSQPGGICLIRSHPVIALQIVNSIVVGNNNPLESPFRTQDVRKQFCGSTTGDTIYFMIGIHYRQSPAFFDGFFEWIQIDFLEQSRWYVGWCPVQPTFWQSVADEMFQSGYDTIFQIIALQPFYVSCSHFCYKIGVFSECLFDSSPSWVSGHV